MRTQDDTFHAIRMPLHDQVLHFDRLAGLRMPMLKRLPNDSAAEFLEVSLQQLLLLNHPRCSSRTRTNSA
jgi:hypothetical protein